MGVELAPISRCLNFQSVKSIYCRLGETAELLCATKCDMELLVWGPKESPETKIRGAEQTRREPTTKQEGKKISSIRRPRDI